MTSLHLVRPDARAWEPVIAGTDARRARALIGAIVRRGRRSPAAPRTGGLGGHCAWALGLALLAPDLDGSAARLGDALDAMSGGTMSAAYHDGYAGIGAVVAFLGDRSPLDGGERRALLALIDDGVARTIRRAPAGAARDVMGGTAGLGIYLVERRPTAAIRASLGRLVRWLACAAEPAGDGLAWRRPASALGEALRPRFPTGFYDLGLAHGVPGIVTTLARIHARGVEVDESRRLIEAAIGWLRSCRRRRARDLFPGYLGPDGATFAPRFGWCSGDLGVALALVHAGDALGRADWIADGVAIARARAGHADDPSVDDAGLCHGSAGLALVFQRFYQRTGHAELADAAIRWHRRTLASPRCHGGEDGLLGGSIGVALSLAAGVMPREPRWDRLMLVSSEGWS